MDIIKRIKRNGTREKEVLQALQKKDGSVWEEDKVVYMEGRIYIPNNKDIKEEILKEHHDPADVGHLGQHKMQEKLSSWFIFKTNVFYSWKVTCQVCIIYER